MGTVSFPGVKRQKRWPPTPSSAEVKERAELYLYSPSGPSWPVLGWTLILSNYFLEKTEFFKLAIKSLAWSLWIRQVVDEFPLRMPEINLGAVHVGSAV
jgi:hypothetical protein